MKEYVMKDDEFKKLVKGRTHWTIEQEPIHVSDMAGGKVIQTGERRLILLISGISKEDTKHVVAMKIGFGTHFARQPEYAEMMKKIEEYALKNFPEATRGAFE